MKAADVRKELQSIADPNKAAILHRFFKTAPGQYGEGDTFIGVMLPQSRLVAKKFSQLPLEEVKNFLTLPFTRRGCGVIDAYTEVPQQHIK